MNRFWEAAAPWVNRVLLGLAAALFTFIGMKYLARPVDTSALDGISLGTPAAITDMRVTGALFVACGLITLRLLTSAKRHRAGLTFVAIVIGAVTLARIYGFVLDGTAPATVLKMKNEIVLLAIFSASLWFESIRKGAKQ